MGARILDLVGFPALALALLLASPGVRVSHAEENFSYDPALEPTAQASAPGMATAVRLDPGPSCAANGAAAPVVPLRGLPFLVAEHGEGEDGLNSLNGRGYNIGKREPSMELQRLLMEARRQGR